MKDDSKVVGDQGVKRRPMLRNANINYSRGTFFVTIQAAFNKTIFGAIVGEKCVLNELGEAIVASLKSLVAALAPQRNSTRSTCSTRPNNQEEQQ